MQFILFTKHAFLENSGGINMLNTIYDILGIIIEILATIVLVDETVIKIKNKNKSIISSMIRGILSSNLFTVSIIRMILAIILGKSIIENIFFAILWIICTISNFLYLITLESSNNKDI